MYVEAWSGGDAFVAGVGQLYFGRRAVNQGVLEKFRLQKKSEAPRRDLNGKAWSGLHSV